MKGGTGVLDPLSNWLREQRLARGWSVAEMGRQIQLAAKATGDRTVPRTAILASYVRRWEKGQIGVTERYRLHYCAALGIPPGQFGPSLPQQAAHPQPAHTPSVQAHSGSSAADGPPRSLLAEPPVDDSGYREGATRDNFTERPERPVPAASLGQLMAMIAEESLDFGEWVGMSEVADATIERYATQVRQLSAGFEYAPPLPLLLETRRLRERVAVQLRARQQPGQARDLYLIAAQVCGLLAWMSGDLGSYRAADAHAWTAWLCAEQAGHDGARAWVRATQAKLAYWDGRYGESAQLAEDGLRYESADTAHAFLALFQARALAQSGRRDEAGQVLARAETERDRAADPDLLGGVWGLTPGRYYGMAATTWMLLDEPAQVLTAASQAVAMSESAPGEQRHIYSETLARIDQAEAYLRQPDLEAAAAALGAVLSLHPDSRIDPVTQRLMRLGPALAVPDVATSRQARDLQEEIEAYCGEAIPRQLSA